MKRLEIHPERMGSIKARAATVFKKYGCTVPIDLHQILAAVEEVELHHDDYGDEFEGAIAYDEVADQYHIHLNTRTAERDSNRARFTLAHELGHYFLTEHAYDLATGKLPRYRFPAPLKNIAYAEALAEAEADCFAGNLLVPDDELDAEINRRAAGNDAVASAAAVRRLAKHFQVSFLCAASRYVERTEDRCAIVAFPADPLRIPWGEVSVSFERKFGLSRNSRLRRFPPPLEDFLAARRLGSWFQEVIPSAKDHPVSADVTKSKHGVFVVLVAS